MCNFRKMDNQKRELSKKDETAANTSDNAGCQI